jgi:hypothetical protein
MTHEIHRDPDGADTQAARMAPQDDRDNREPGISCRGCELVNRQNHFQIRVRLTNNRSRHREAVPGRTGGCRVHFSLERHSACLKLSGISWKQVRHGAGVISGSVSCTDPTMATKPMNGFR